MIRSFRHHKFCILDTANIGKSYAHRVRLNKAVFISRKNSYLFVKNEKAGNNTARMTLQTLEAGGTLPSGFRSQRRHSGPLLQPSDLRLSRVSDLNSLGLFRFAVVQNPYSRVLSSNLNKIKKVDRKQKIFMRRAGLDPAQPASFAEFLEAISLRNPDEMDPHWRPQYDNLYCDIIEYDNIVRVESYDQEFGLITRKIYGQEKMVQVRKGENRSQDFQSRYYTPDLTRIVNQVYSRDFSQFGYQQN